MSKLELWSQERMDMKTVPLPDKRGYKSFVEYIEDDAVPSEKKINIIWKLAHMPTLNGVTKGELQTMLKWLVEHHYYCAGED